MNKFPVFKSDEEEARFWETHSVADYWDKLQEADVEFVRRKKETFTIRMDPRDVQLIEKMAELKGLTQSALMRMWIKEKLLQERKKAG